MADNTYYLCRRLTTNAIYVANNMYYICRRLTTNAIYVTNNMYYICRRLTTNVIYVANNMHYICRRLTTKTMRLTSCEPHSFCRKPSSHVVKYMILCSCRKSTGQIYYFVKNYTILYCSFNYITPLKKSLKCIMKICTHEPHCNK